MDSPSALRLSLTHSHRGSEQRGNQQSSTSGKESLGHTLLPLSKVASQLGMLPCTTAGICQGLPTDNAVIEWLLFPFHVRERHCSKRAVTPVPTCSLSSSDDQGSLTREEGHGFSHTRCFFSDTVSVPWLFLMHARPGSFPPPPV